MIVVDASTLVDMLSGSALAADRLSDEALHAPHLVDIEVAHVLRRVSRRGELEAARARRALTLLGELELFRYPHTSLLPRVWELKDNLSAYDALYVALAEMLGASLVTLDARIAAAPGIRATVEVIARG